MFMRSVFYVLFVRVVIVLVVTFQSFNFSQKKERKQINEQIKCIHDPSVCKDNYVLVWLSARQASA